MNLERESGRPAIPPLFRRIGSSLLLAVALTLLGAVVQRALWMNGIFGIAAYLDNLLVGLLAGLLVFVYELQRTKDVRQKLTTISAMNHHIRNALQEIACVKYAAEAEQVQIIRRSVSKIEWALREILPGTNETNVLIESAFMDPADVMCPLCHAGKQAPCENTNTFHRERIEAAQEAGPKASRSPGRPTNPFES